MISKTYRLSTLGDVLMVEIVEIPGAPEFTEARGVHNTTNLALVNELGSRVVMALDSDTRAATRQFMRREMPFYRGGAYESAIAGNMSYGKEG